MGLQHNVGDLNVLLQMQQRHFQVAKRLLQAPDA
jgi:hypothetical protein